jgi:hypothetical protein
MGGMVDTEVTDVRGPGIEATVRATKTSTRDKEGNMLDTRALTWSLASFSTVTYLVCVLYGLVAPDALHMTAFLEQVLPGFRWLTPAGFVIGLVESFLYGAYAGLVFTPIYNRFNRRWPAA